MNPPSVNLTPGSSGSDVVALQRYLISQGYSIPDGATGYYGNQTKAAVAQLQQKLGVKTDSSSAGFYGPLTQKAISTSTSKGSSSLLAMSNTPTSIQNSTGGVTTASTTATTPTTAKTTTPVVPTTTNTSTNTSTNTNTSAGTSKVSTTPTSTTSSNVSNANNSTTPTINTQTAILSAIADANTNATTASRPAVTLQEAIDLATKDPNIIAKYADALKLDTQGFTQALGQIQTALSTETDKDKQQFENDRKALAEAHAAAGTAYSGFRGEAQKQLSDTENAVVTSSRTAAQKSVNDLTTAFEQKYGSAATQAATANYSNPLTTSNISASGLYTPTTRASEQLTGTLAGGITGSEVVSKQNDILSEASKNPDVTSNLGTLITSK